MQINLSTHPPDLQKHKCLVLGCFSDEKPPRGACGLIDWRLNSLISREIKQGHINGEFQEKVIIPFPGRIKADFLFLFGLGGLSDISYDRMYNAAYEIAGAVDALKFQEFSFDLPGDGRSKLNAAGMLEAMITGFFDCLSRDIRKLDAMNICLITSSDRLDEVARGIAQFKKNVKHSETVDCSALQPHFT